MPREVYVGGRNSCPLQIPAHGHRRFTLLSPAPSLGRSGENSVQVVLQEDFVSPWYNTGVSLITWVANSEDLPRWL